MSGAGVGMTLADLKQWGGWIMGGIAFIGAVWNRLGLKSLQIKTDGLLEIRSRADRAEGRLDEQSDVRDRADKKEQDAK